MEVKKRVFVYEHQFTAGQNKTTKVRIGEGVFHQFGIGFEEYENGAGQFTTAIVEMPNGEVKSVPVELIRFDYSIQKVD